MKSVVQLSQYDRGKFVKSKSITIYKSIEDVKKILKFNSGKDKIRIRISQFDNNNYIKTYSFTIFGRLDDIYNKLKSNNFSGKDMISRIFDLTKTENTKYFGEYNNIHKGLWCLCKQDEENTIVLHVCEDVSFLTPLKLLYKYTTFLIDPNGNFM